jgi:hypothetical protein
LNEVERTHGRGEEKEALIDWYLEKKEGEGAIENLEELEMEKELIGKVIAKLVKVRQFKDRLSGLLCLWIYTGQLLDCDQRRHYRPAKPGGRGERGYECGRRNESRIKAIGIHGSSICGC